MSWPASCIMRSRAKRSGDSAMIVFAPLDRSRFNISGKPGRSATGVRARDSRVIVPIDNLVTGCFGEGFDRRKLAILRILIGPDVCAARRPEIRDGFLDFLAHFIPPCQFVAPHISIVNCAGRSSAPAANFSMTLRAVSPGASGLRRRARVT